MEKLLNLLQEFYWENRKFSNDDWLLTMTNWVENLSGAYAQTYIISKQGWFIKWLVENDKIDFENMEWHWRLIWYLTDNMEKPTRDKVKEELVIMLLSISNSPIEDLLLYLK